MWLCHVPPTDKNRNRNRNSKDETVDHRFLGSLVIKYRALDLGGVSNSLVRAWLGGANSAKVGIAQPCFRCLSVGWLVCLE
jgi:hypothetical protein